MNVQINVITCKALTSRIHSIKNTWGKHHNDIAFYADFTEEPNIFHCTDNSSSSGNEEKTVNRFKQLKKNNNYDWYFFVDDDTFINIPNMLSFVSELESEYAYGVECENWPTDPNLKYFAGGAGFFISSSSIDRIKDETLYTRGSTFGDVVVGQILDDNNIIKKFKGKIRYIPQYNYNLIDNHDRLFFHDENIHCLSTKDVKAAVTFHHVANRMEELYRSIYEKC